MPWEAGQRETEASLGNPARPRLRGNTASRNPAVLRPGWRPALPPWPMPHLMLHLEALHEAEVSEHPDRAQGRLQVRQLEVTEAEVCDLEGLGRWHHGSLGREEREKKLLPEAAADHEAFSRRSREPVHCDRSFSCF